MMSDDTSPVMIVVLGPALLSVMLGVAAVVSLRYREHPAIRWRGLRAMLERVLLICLWVLSMTLTPVLSPASHCALGVIIDALFWAALACVACQLWCGFISWTTINRICVIKHTLSVVPAGTLQRYRRDLSSPAVQALLTIFIVGVGVAEAIVAYAVARENGSQQLEMCLHRSGVFTCVCLIVYGIAFATLSYRHRKLDDTFGIVLESKAIATIVTCSAFLSLFRKAPTATTAIDIAFVIVVCIGVTMSTFGIPVRAAVTTPVVAPELRQAANYLRIQVRPPNNPVVQGYGNLFDVMDSPKGLANLKDFCKAEMSSENVVYLELSRSIARKHGLPDITKRRGDAGRACTVPANLQASFIADLSELCLTFLIADAPMLLNFSVDVRNLVTAFLEVPQNDIQQRVQKGIEMLYTVDDAVCETFVGDAFARFRRSKAYATLVV
ncbi:RGS domain-containing protein [Plasmodiophora brassicae]